MTTMPKTTRTRHGMALRADFAGVAFLAPADLNFAMISYISVDRSALTPARIADLHLELGAVVHQRRAFRRGESACLD